MSEYLVELRRKIVGLVCFSVSPVAFDFVELMSNTHDEGLNKGEVRTLEYLFETSQEIANSFVNSQHIGHSVVLLLVFASHLPILPVFIQKDRIINFYLFCVSKFRKVF